MLLFCLKHNKVKVAVCIDVECLSEESMIDAWIQNQGILINPLTAICKKSNSNSEMGVSDLFLRDCFCSLMRHWLLDYFNHVYNNKTHL